MRRDAVTVEEQAKRAPGRKDRKRYCKPNRGAHTPVMVKPSMFAGKQCGWRPDFQPRTGEWVPDWLCIHQEECSGCGRFFCFVRGEDCPDFRPATPGERQELDAEIERRAQVRREYEARKPVVTGPQSYRRSRRM